MSSHQCFGSLASLSSSRRPPQLYLLTNVSRPATATIIHCVTETMYVERLVYLQYTGSQYHESPASHVRPCAVYIDWLQQRFVDFTRSPHSHPPISLIEVSRDFVLLILHYTDRLVSKQSHYIIGSDSQQQGPATPVSRLVRAMLERYSQVHKVISNPIHDHSSSLSSP